MTEDLPVGVYEMLRTRRLDALLAEPTTLQPEFTTVDDRLAPEVLARYVRDVMQRRLGDEADGAERLALVNNVLRLLDADDDGIPDELEELISVQQPPGPSAYRFTSPRIPLSQGALITNARGEPGLGAELRTELVSADRVDLLCAFVRWYGLRVLEEPLTQLRERGVPLRVICTTYTGSTERKAMDALVRRFGAEVRISYETDSTRLHAKAWLLQRNSGYDTAFIGSSNLSKSALIDGVEWNVRLSGVATPDLIRKFAATFESYWSDPAFAPYDPDQDGDRLDDALAAAGNRGGSSPSINISGLQVTARPHQATILEALDAERELHNRHQNLVVAATGTGKTVVAALDYQRLRDAADKNLSLLFVAHRKEILDQSLRMYREVLADGSFGEHYVGGARPERWQHVFASVQSLASYGVESLPANHFDVVVIDEFHHAEAPTYQRLLNNLRPQELLGLTATPERGDGTDVRALFDGRTAYELRLWDALDADLLAPFHYFGIADDVDLSGLEWKRGSYDAGDLDRVYTGNDARAGKVLRELRDKVNDVGRMQALGFCVSVAHAEYMARVFTQHGIAALAVSGTTARTDRTLAFERLQRGEVQCLFAADLFNEGLDLPHVDTLLLLRPTSSATVFLQQLGRGLRKAHNKPVLTMLDFIGQQRREFRFDVRYRALANTSRRGLERQIENGFPFLPSGCQVVLDRVSQSIVLDNVRRQLRLTRKELVSDVRSHGDLPLDRYLAESGRELVDIYRGGGTWTSLRRDAGLPTPAPGPDEAALLGRVSGFLHVDDSERAELYSRLATPEGPAYEELNERDQRLARMLFFLLWPNRGGFSSYSGGIARLQQHPAVCAEVRDLVELGVDAARYVPRSLGEGLQHVPMFSHAHYRREEVLAALDWASMERKAHGHTSGVAWAPETKTDALLVNLHKSERDFTPSTMYRDYAISQDLFHWESQNATSTAAPAGRRYLNHAAEGTHVVLFVRESPTDEFGAAPFLCLGQVQYVEHRGERPIAITWRLDRFMPGDAYQRGAVVAV